MNLDKLRRIFKTSKMLIPIFIASLFLGAFLFYYIPVAMQDGLIKSIVKHSKEDVQRLQTVREYYTEAVVGDVKKYAPNLSFDYSHAGVDGKLPFPTTTIHDLSARYSKNSDVKFQLYSNYPFLNRKDRVLTPFQKEAIEMVEKNENGIYFKKDEIDGKTVLRVAVADYMVLPACVSCHNTHALKDWDFQWKLGDKRGVLEIITPLDEALEEMYISRNKIVTAALALMLMLFTYYLYILLKREKELQDENDELSEDYQDIFKDFDKNVIASKTDLKGNMTYVSKHFCKMSGYSEKELLGKNHNMIRHQETPTELFKDMWDTLKSDNTWKGEIKNRTKKGSHYWVDCIISPIVDHNGKKVGYSAIRHDVTDKKNIKRIAEENRKKDRQMMQQSRLAQMGEMISMIAHQWRQPLTAISATSADLYLKNMLDNYDKEYFHKKLENIDSFSQHLSTTIDDFRNFYKEDKAKEYAHYSKIIQGTLQIVESSLEEKNIKIITDFECQSPIYILPNELRQVILNLIKNSEDILIEKEVQNPYISIRTYDDGDYSCLEVLDNGGGIPEEIIEKIFDPYFSTKTRKDGTGLGLYMSQIIIKEHSDGELLISNYDDGACFTIKIPIKRESDNG